MKRFICITSLLLLTSPLYAAGPGAAANTDPGAATGPASTDTTQTTAPTKPAAAAKQATRGKAGEHAAATTPAPAAAQTSKPHPDALQAATGASTPPPRVTPEAFGFNAPRISPFWWREAYQHHPNVFYPERLREPVDPVVVIKDTLDKITTFTSSDNINPIALREFIETEIIPHFDFDNMAHWITGPYARYMSTEEKIRFQQQLRETFLSSLARHLGSFDAKNTRIRFMPAQYRGSSEAFVRTMVYRPNTRPMRLNFRMRLDENNDWKIIDVRADGASAVLYYRKHFMSQLRQYRSQYQRPPAPPAQTYPRPY